MTIRTKHRCDLHVSFSNKFQKGFTKLESYGEMLGFRYGIAVQEEFYLDRLKLEETTDTLFRKVSNQFPTDDAQHPRKANTWNKVVRINFPHAMNHVRNDIGSIKVASNLCHIIPTLYRDLPQRKISGPEEYE
jgi:hypothetical protein